jgi:hypothetical protein
MSDCTSRARIEESLTRVIGWVRAHDYKGYEPADGNASVLFPLTGGRVWPMRILQQIVLRSPINIRPWLGVAPHESAIGRGYMGWAYLTMFRTSTASDIRNEAITCLSWLMMHRATKQAEFCWGDPYEYATRGGRRPRGAPILIWTSIIGQVFLDAFDLLGDEKYLRVAESVGRWMATLPVEHTDTGSCLSYNAYKQSSIHNANVMGAAFLARLGAKTGDDAALDLARRTMTYTCARQRSDGSWFYGEEQKYQWVDNFHTAYNISALNVYRHALQDNCVEESLRRGLTYFKKNFFEEDGRPKYFHNQTYPVDIQCAAQAIETLVSVSQHDPDSFELAMNVAEWTIANLQSADGHFNYRHLGWITVTTPMLHWGQATMAKALAVTLDSLEAQSRSDR